jgi:hypothetical protein
MQKMHLFWNILCLDVNFIYTGWVPISTDETQNTDQSGLTSICDMDVMLLALETLGHFQI